MRPIRNLYWRLAVLRVLRKRMPGLTVSGLRRWAIYRPLAIAMALLLMLPVFSRFESGGAGARPFLASAQTGSGCAPAFSNAVIQVGCANGQLFNLFGDLTQLESDAVNAYLGLHNLPSTDASVIYNYGRTDLRDGVRGTMMSTMLGIIAKPAASRTQHEQFLYNWLQTLVQQNEISLYTNAVNQFHAWKANPCTFTLDPAIASAYGLSYNGAPFCFPSLNSLFGQDELPAESYFTAYGLKQSFGAAANSYAYFGALTAGMSLSVGEVAGIATAAGGIVAAATAGVLAASLAAALTAFTTGTAVTAGAASTSAAFILSGSTVAELGAGALAAGPAAIIGIAILIGVAAAMQLASEDNELNDLANMTAILNQVKSTPPDLNALATDTSGLGMYELQTTLAAQTVPEVASTAALPAHRSATDLDFAISSASGGTPVVSSTLTYRDWGGATWSAQTWGGWFVQTCTGEACTQADSITASIRYVDWSGINWTASRIGNNFISTKAQPASTDSPCPASTLTGVSAGTDFSKCSSYASATIPLTDGDGNHVSAGLTLLSQPTFTSPTTLVFSPGTASTQTVTAAGSPTPNVCLVGGTPSSDFSLNGGNNCGTGSFQVTFNGDINAPTQVYQLSFGASNGIGTAAFQTISLNVSPQLAIISPSTLNGTGGVPVNFKVTATGVPTPKLSVVGWNLNSFGLNFTDNGNGTATISGVVAHPPTAFICLSGSCGIQATNSQGTVFQSLSLNFALSPEATLVPPDNTNFVAGAPNQALLTSTGAITPVSWALSAAGDTPLPSWLSLQDNGNGTALLKGTPPIGASGALPFYIVTDALGAFGGGYNNSFTINVVDAPVFLSPNTATFTVGDPGSFDISTNGGTVSLVNTLPQGLSFTSFPSITGTPAAGTGGQYTITLADDAGPAGSTSQSLNLNVYEAPKITSANKATFFSGVPGSFAVTTTGFPSLSAHPVQLGDTPTSPEQGDGMAFHVAGFPLGLRVSNLNSQGFATGTLIFQGTPSVSEARVYEIGITALNGVGAAAEQTLTLNIIPVTPAPSGAISATASGLAYSRVSQTFNGTVTLKNVSGDFINGPFQVVFTGLAQDVALANATNLLNGAPYMTVPGVTGLNSGQTAVVNVQFKNPSNAAINFTPVVYGGVN